VPVGDPTGQGDLGRVVASDVPFAARVASDHFAGLVLRLGFLCTLMIVVLLSLPGYVLASHATLTGSVTIGGKPAEANVTVKATLEDGTECGTFTTGEGGTYEFSVSEDCQVGSTLEFFRAATTDQAETTVVIDGGPQEANIAFGAEATAAPLSPAEPSRPLEGTDLYVVVAVVVGAPTILLGLMVWFGRHGGRRTRGQAEADQYGRQIEGMVLIMVILAVILLGVTDKIGSDGLISVLAAIVGYAVGRGVSERQGQPPAPPQPPQPPQPQTPTVTGFDPRSGPPGQEVSITGTGFDAQTEVRFGTSAAEARLISANLIVATVPDLPPGQVRIVVTTPGGTATSSEDFSIE
jgi:IPT/TIG domain